jgi:hypothetical protein
MVVEDRERAMKAVRGMWDRYNAIHKIRPINGFDNELMADLKLLDAGMDGWVVFELKVTERYCNLNCRGFRLCDCSSSWRFGYFSEGFRG